MEMTDYFFSFFRKPIQNIEPIRAVGIVDVYRYIIGHYAQPQTEKLRQMQSSPEAKKYKASHVDYCTFSGSVSYTHLLMLQGIYFGLQCFYRLNQVGQCIRHFLQ